MWQAVAGMTAHRDEMSSSEYQHSSFTTTPGNLEEVLLKYSSSVLSLDAISRASSLPQPLVAQLLARMYFGSCSCGQKAKATMYVPPNQQMSGRSLPEPSLFVCLKKQPSCSTSAPHHRIHHTH
ncbi:hypothetical protein FCULG_00004370 [Fusarium culmorum]|uniref:Uncharacterized protein n=1 Tax=Fusarium culmorum TaxID=5516 RepID=A0A2T4H9L7_FUSCU|nr:hypothetical protein FCULG_00004370 [Fusarium culmorum]